MLCIKYSPINNIVGVRRHIKNNEQKKYVPTYSNNVTKAFVEHKMPTFQRK